MKRLLLILLLLIVMLFGMLFSSLNSIETNLDLYVDSVSLPLGVLVLLSLFLGCLGGGSILLIAVIWPLRMKISTLRKQCALVEKSRSTGSIE
jgi:uncharacterized integral membrane protein